jgi:hypothetical protein
MIQSAGVVLLLLAFAFPARGAEQKPRIVKTKGHSWILPYDGDREGFWGFHVGVGV